MQGDFAGEDFADAPDPGDSEAVDPLADLSDREHAFVLAYIGNAGFKATKAAAAAGYTGDRHTLKVTGCRVKQRPHVQAAISALVDAECSTTLECLVRITRRARATLSDLFVIDAETGGWRFDIKHACETGGTGTSCAMDAVRKLTLHRKVRDGRVIEESFSIELYDALKADAFLLRYYGLPRLGRAINGRAAEGNTIASGVFIMPPAPPRPPQQSADAVLSQSVQTGPTSPALH